jgi:cytosine/adenosine deaminase-related metal-dependent hydrolase
MLKLGIRVGLGVDGSASNDTSDMLGEVRNCFLVQRLGGGSSALTARQAIDAATRGGASLLGRDDLGALREGLVADLTGIDVSDISHAGSFHDPLASVVMCGSSHNVSLTVVNGKVVVRDGRLAAVDEREIVEHANQAARRMIERS